MHTELEDRWQRHQQVVKEKKKPTMRMPGASFFPGAGDFKNKHRALPFLAAN